MLGLSLSSVGYIRFILNFFFFFLLFFFLNSLLSFSFGFVEYFILFNKAFALDTIVASR